ncbi:cilia- and flagella-associated protein 20-like [Vanessa atalanta]|uniref:cilia- and flagella-associated protein 20-like n=1 Tax=Vanessa atalanta TaxID=42275 RepID=UPI001FCD03A4|nr:cilia- and flagella-associated protein 20-like [Vanessa atalanta]
MYRNAYQRGMLTVFFSVGSKPLAIWDTHTQDGYITRFLDQDIKSMVLEIGGTNVSTTYITCPKGQMVLGITMPFLVMIVKNLKKYFSFEVTILDETGTRRRFRVSNFQSSTQILPLCTVMPIGLSEGWNQIQFNLAEFTRRAYKKQYVEVQKLKINANIRLRRVYFTERLVPEDQLPPEYKLYFPLTSKYAKDKKAIQSNVDKENVKPSTSQSLKERSTAQSREGLRSKVDLVRSSKSSVHSNKKVPLNETKGDSKTAIETVKEESINADKEQEQIAEDSIKKEENEDVKEESETNKEDIETNKEESETNKEESETNKEENKDNEEESEVKKEPEEEETAA